MGIGSIPVGVSGLCMLNSAIVLPHKGHVYYEQRMAMCLG